MSYQRMNRSLLILSLGFSAAVLSACGGGGGGGGGGGVTPPPPPSTVTYTLDLTAVTLTDMQTGAEVVETGFPLSGAVATQ